MDTNAFSQYLAHQAERPVLEAQSNRARLAEQAVASTPSRQRAGSVRQAIGSLMIVTGQRLHGAPAPHVIGISATRAR